jgi:alpha-aminoadipic semialdehyde synthase
MINSLWSLGARLRVQGVETPFTKIRQSHTYNSLEEAKNDIRQVGLEIAANGLPKEICPLTIGFTGYGNVSMGAQEIANLLPSMEVSPEELMQLKDREDLPCNLVFKTVFKEWDLSQPNNPEIEFDLQHYYQHPDEYHNIFEQYVPHLTVLMNCMYWAEQYPRILTKDYLKELFSVGIPKLKVIGDVTCDPDGSIECTHKGTEIEDPVFVYNPMTDEYTMGFEGDGVVDMAVDILPSELPRESSIAFSNALLGYVKAIASADYHVSFDDLDIPGPIKRAMILHRGKLTPDYEYISEHLDN